MTADSCYIAGPMRGIDRFNFPAFDSAAAYLRKCGWAVLSPAEHDRWLGFDETKNSLDGFDLNAALKWDLNIIPQVDRVFVLPGWEDSTGVTKFELPKAAQCGIPVQTIYPDLLRAGTGGWYLGDTVDLTPYENIIVTHPYTDEVRITDPVTGGQKGQKPAQIGAMDPKALLELAKVAGFGADKYEAFNYLKGYSWRLSYDAAQRHLMQLWAGDDLDDESGLSHAAHAAWHCLALVSFAVRGLGTDDRPPQ